MNSIAKEYQSGRGELGIKVEDDPPHHRKKGNDKRVTHKGQTWGATRVIKYTCYRGILGVKVWRLLKIFIHLKDFFGPSYLLMNSLAWGLRGRPQFKVLYAVVGSVAVFMVDVFVHLQRATKVQLHYVSVFYRVTYGFAKCAIWVMDCYIPRLVYASVIRVIPSHSSNGGVPVFSEAVSVDCAVSALALSASCELFTPLVYASTTDGGLLYHLNFKHV